MEEISKLNKKIEVLEKENEVLKKEIHFLKTHPVFTKGLKGEQLVCKITNGKATAFSEGHDVITDKNIKIEVKYSKLTRPVLSSKVKRWIWSKPLGYLDKGKDYDYLLLIGDKDYTYPSQYLDSSPYVFFLLPISVVKDDISAGKSIGGNAQLTTNFKTVRSNRSKIIIEHMISKNDINDILSTSIET